MRTYRLTLLAGVLALVTMALLSVSAAARTRVEAEPASTLIRFTSARLTFAATVIIICEITLSGSLSRLVNKVRGEVAGSMSEGRAGNCVNEFGQREPETFARPLIPMAIQFDSITGTLPAITGGRARIVGGFLIRTNVLGRNGCLFSGAVPVTAVENPTTRLRLGANTIRLARSLEGICPREGELLGTLTLDRAVTSILLER